MPYLKFFLFDLPRFEQAGHLLTVSRNKSIALAAYLAVTQRPQSREVLSTLLWPEHDQESARSSLGTTLWHLKNCFGTDWLAVDRKQIALKQDQKLWVDVNQFRDLLAECNVLDHALQKVSPASIRNLTQAVDLYTNDFMAGFTLSDNELFEDWKRIEADNLSRELIRALEKIVCYYSEREEFEQAILYARRWLKTDPLDESVHQHLMQLFSRAGRPAAALRQYEQCRRILMEELKTKPQEALTNLYLAIKDHQATFQNRAAFSKGSQIMEQPVFCIGRDKELKEIKQMLANPDCRLLTLIGLGGAGKTTVALKALSENRVENKRGLYFIPLTHLKSAELMAAAIADELGITFHKEAELHHQLLTYLHDKDFVLVLDNFEYTIKGVELIAEIMSKAPKIKLLVTSQQSLNLKSEWILEIRGLDCPADESVKDIEGYGAIQLFMQISRRLKPDFETCEEDKQFIIRICRLLGGIPLGIELAASWMRMFSCREISLEIERDFGFLSTTQCDMPERHRSLQIVFEHSLKLLSEEEKSTLKELSVFRGGFYKEAAEEVAHIPLQVLLALMNKAFLFRNRAGRFEILEVMRQFIKVKAEMSRERLEDIQSRHAAYYAQFIAQRDQPLKRFKNKDILNEINMEIENIRAGWEWSILNKNTSLIDQYLETLFPYYELRGFYFYAEEALSKAAVVLQYSGDTQNKLKEVIGKILSMQGWLHHFFAHFEKARQLLQLSISIFERSDMQKELAIAYFRLGHLLYDSGEIREAENLLQKSLSIFKTIDFQEDIWECRKNLANIHLILGEYTEAKTIYEQCLAVYQEMGNKYKAGGIFLNLGILMEIQNQYEEAKRFYQESLACYRDTEDRLRMTACHTGLGFVSFHMGAYKEAREFFKNALRIAMEMNVPHEGQQAVLGLAALNWKQAKDETVFEIIGHILCNPLTQVWSKKRTEKLLDELRLYISAPPLSGLLSKGKSKGLDFYLKLYQTDEFD